MIGAVLRPQDAKIFSKGSAHVPDRLCRFDPARRVSARWYVLEWRALRPFGCLATPSLPGPLLCLRCRARDHLFRDGLDDFSAKLLVRRAWPSLSLLVGARIAFDDFFRDSDFARHLRRIQPPRLMPTIAGGAEDCSMGCGVHLRRRGRLRRHGPLGAAPGLSRREPDQHDGSGAWQGPFVLPALVAVV